jgi:hypothetical protein
MYLRGRSLASARNILMPKPLFWRAKEREGLVRSEREHHAPRRIATESR